MLNEKFLLKSYATDQYNLGRDMALWHNPYIRASPWRDYIQHGAINKDADHERWFLIIRIKKMFVLKRSNLLSIDPHGIKHS